jgi:hypothetical protein
MMQDISPIKCSLFMGNWPHRVGGAVDEAAGHTNPSNTIRVVSLLNLLPLAALTLEASCLLFQLMHGMNTRSLIWDLSSLEQPVLKAVYLADTAATDHNAYVWAGYVYLASYSAGLRVLDTAGLKSRSSSLLEVR